MEEPRDNTPGIVVNIATDGDVILVVGPEKAKLRIQSLFLKAASKPFSAMFGPDWKEGHDILDLRAPVELSLPEDSASATKAYLCHYSPPEQEGASIPCCRRRSTGCRYSGQV